MKFDNIKKYKVFLLILFVNLMYVADVSAATLYSIKVGNWTDPSVWFYTSGGPGCGCTPVSSDNVYIKTNVTLNIDLTGGTKVAGILQIESGFTLNGSDKNMDIANGGTLIINGILKIADLTLYNISTETVGPTGELYVSGNFSNRNNNTGVTINGTMTVSGDFSNGTGASIVGSGTIIYEGTFVNNGTINGSNSGTGLINLGSTLPVSMTSVNIKCTSTGSLLAWTTASEVNNHFFTVEKSTDMLNWKISTTIQGAFNSNELRNYEFLDQESNDVTTYYRLKQTDLDGQYKYFDALAILCKLGNDNFELVGLNVSEKHLNLIIKTLGFSPVSIEFFDIYGRKFSESSLNPTTGANIVNIDVPSIKPGVYIVVLLQDGVKITRKIYIS